MISKNTVFILVITLAMTLFYSRCTPKMDSCSFTSEDALQEVKLVKELLREKSPYMDINSSRVLASLNTMEEHLQGVERIGKFEFSILLKKSLAELGDRHFLLYYGGDCHQEAKYFLPFSLAPWKGNVAVALVKEPKLKFSLYLKEFPFLTKINDQSFDDFLGQYDPENKHAPDLSRGAWGVEKLNELHKLKLGLKSGDEMRFTFSDPNFTSDTTLVLNLVETKHKWRDVKSYLFYQEGNEKINNLLFQEYNNKVSYLKVPKMYRASKHKDYFNWLQQKMNEVKTSKALVLDLRDNSGGNRDLIRFFSNYFIEPRASYLVNLARFKGVISEAEKKDFEDKDLRSYSDFYDEDSKQKIHRFQKDFDPVVRVDSSGYSECQFMILKNQQGENTFYYNRPVYILANETTFSAASVLVSAFKGVKNITIAGEITDGSSGMSRSYDFHRSNIRIRFSHMLSYQKNGELFDGVGTVPDIRIERSMDQILGHEDSQLKKVLEMINSENAL